MKLTSLLQKLLLLPMLLVLTVAITTGCKDDNIGLQEGNGYVQFKVYKEASYVKPETASRATSDELNYLSDAKKIKVVLTSNGVTSSYTLPLNSYNAENAEYGLRSEKQELISGTYQLVGFYLYDKVEKQIYAGEPAEPTSFNVETGGLCIQDILVNAVPRGKVRFHIVKDLSAVNKSRSGEGDKYYPFSAIERVTIDVKNLDTKQITKFENLKVKMREDFNEDMSETAYALVDTLVTLEAGNYSIDYIWTLDKSKTLLEVGNIKAGTEFTVADNQNPENSPVKVPVTLQESAEYIKDYVALREIWTALNGKEWSYVGENYSRGVNWNFDKDIDMWGVQPGVGLNDKGRVTSLSIGEFGPKGCVPAAIGQLTALQSLSLGTHNDWQHPNVPNGSSKESRRKFKSALMNPIGDNLAVLRDDYMNNYVMRDIRQDFSEPILWGLKNKGENVVKWSAKPSGRDINFGELTNGITGIDPAIGNLVNLEVLYIANSLVAELPSTIKNLENCTDMELYNNPKMIEFPSVLAEMPGLVQLNLAMNKQWNSGAINAGIEDLFNGASKDKLQMLYLGFNNITKIPQNVKNLKKLGKLDCVYNSIEGELPPFTGINLVQAAFDNNKITGIPANFCGIEDVESLSFSNNEIKELPKNFFNPSSVYIMKSVDFSSNNITDAGIPDNYGVNVSTLSLARNQLTKFPKGLIKGGSTVDMLNLSGNLIETFEEGDIVGEKSYMLSSLDLTYNRLKKFPKDFNAVNLPYLYGVDISFNCFDHFPYEPLNADRLTVFAIRGQRDSDGNRTLTQWPYGVGQHKGLRALYLGGNDIGDVNVSNEEKLSYLIYNLDISDNPNIVINVAELCPYIQAGMFMLVYDKDQDIRGCDILLKK